LPGPDVGTVVDALGDDVKAGIDADDVGDGIVVAGAWLPLTVDGDVVGLAAAVKSLVGAGDGTDDGLDVEGAAPPVGDVVGDDVDD
jgi:hypothetical protein